MERIIDLQKQLSTRISKGFINKITESVRQHPEDFNSLYTLIASPDTKISWRAAWACHKLSEYHPDWFVSRRRELIGILANSSHEGVKRELLSILRNLPEKKPLPVDLLNYCMEHMLAPGEAVAVQNLSIHLAYKLCLIEPELLCELQTYLENAKQNFYSRAVQTTIKKTLNQINKKQEHVFTRNR